MRKSPDFNIAHYIWEIKLHYTNKPHILTIRVRSKTMIKEDYIHSTN